MPLRREIRHFESIGLAAGAKWEDSWKAEKDYLIRYIFIRRGDGAAYTKSTVTIKIADEPYTRPKALCAIFGTTVEVALPIDEDLPTQTEFAWALVNNEGAAIDAHIELVLEIK